MPSYREGLPKSLAEAAACGRAVVTTNVPGCRDAIEPNKTGFLVPAKDAEALAEKLELLIQHTELRNRMGYAGRSQQRNTSISKIVSNHMEIYKKLWFHNRLQAVGFYL